ncbi:MAG: hypothetical protein LBS93_07905 [Synergistaceae bacterium]|jgi:hypothetical protein|nr:hypothetical protein [Synergistaceae bacterium]
MSAASNVGVRRFLIRLALITALIAIAFVMHSIGKEYNVLLDNMPVTIGGVEYGALAGASLSVDGIKVSNMRPDARATQKMVGGTHRIRLEILKNDKSVERTVERTVKLTLDMKAWMISLPALAGGADDIFIPRPSPAPVSAAPGPDEPDAADVTGVGGEMAIPAEI